MHSLRIRRNYISEFLTICISLFHLQPLSVYCQYDMHIVTVQYPPAIVTHTKKSRVRSRLSVPKKKCTTVDLHPKPVSFQVDKTRTIWFTKSRNCQRLCSQPNLFDVRDFQGKLSEGFFQWEKYVSSSVPNPETPEFTRNSRLLRPNKSTGDLKFRALPRILVKSFYSCAVIGQSSDKFLILCCYWLHLFLANSFSFFESAT